MIITVVILAVLFVGVYGGMRRGLILQLFLTIGYAASLWLALRYYRTVSEYAEMFIPYPNPTSTSGSSFVLYGQDLLFEMDGAFYNGVAFVALLFIGWLLTRFIGGFLNFLTEVPVLKQMNSIGGAVIAFFVHYIGIFFLLSLLSMVPLNSIQSQLESSQTAQFIVSETPRLSRDVYQWWIEGTP